MKKQIGTRFERLYRFAKHYKCSFTYREDGEYRNAFLTKNNIVFDYSHPKYILVNGKRYDDFDLALDDFLSLILLHEGE